MAGVFLALSVACSGGGDTTSTPPPTPSITVMVNSQGAVSAFRGTVVVLPISVTRNDGFAGPVQLAVEGLTSGVIATFPENPLPNSATNTTLSLTTDATAISGTSTVTVRASGTGVASSTASLLVNVLPRSTVTITGGAISVNAGESAQRTVTIARGGNYSGDIINALSGSIPPGVTATFVPIPSTPDAVNMTISTSAALTTPGSYTLTVATSSDGVPTEFTTVNLVVAPAAFSFALGSSTSTLPLARATSNTISVTRRAGFTGTVSFAILTTKYGITYTLPAPTAEATVMPMGLDALPSADQGTYTVIVRGSSPGVPNCDVTLTVVVQPGNKFGVAFVEPTATVTQGGTLDNGDIRAVLFNTATFVQFETIPFPPEIADLSYFYLNAPSDYFLWRPTFKANAPLGTHVYPIVFFESGGIKDTAYLTVNIVPSPRPIFTLTKLADVTVARAQSFQGSIEVTRGNGYDNLPVSFGQITCPTGVSLTFTGANPTTSGAQSFTVSATPSAVLGQASCVFTATATAPGASNRETTINVNVTAASVHIRR